MNEETRYLVFTAKVKHGQLLRYLHAAQIRRRFLEQYQLRRQVKSSALTGDPDRVFEVYYADNPFLLQEGPGGHGGRSTPARADAGHG